MTPIEPQVHAYATARNLHVILKGPQYAMERASREKPLAFISHDSRDKDIARPLAVQLQAEMCPVWYDEFSLKIGDNLRESIDRGLKEAKYCILILSKHFMTNDGWGQAEFDSAHMREMIEKQDVILPVWHGVSLSDVYDYNARLANKVGISTECGIEDIARKLASRIKT